MEKLDISELIEDLMQDEEFKDSCDDESASFALTLYLRDAVGLNWGFPEGEKFKFEDAYSEKGDGKDEETIYGIFKRKSDGKFFKVWVHDSGFIETPTMCDHMEEVRAKEETRKIKTWDKF
jgi:hypothetical protein